MRNKHFLFIVISFVAACFVSYLSASGMAAEEQPPTIEQLAAGEGGGWLPPSIEDLTEGKIKIGDLITKDNVELVKDYISPSLYQDVMHGMVLRMADNLPPEKVTPRFFWEATVKNKGKAVADQNATVRLKDGSVWPGGLPFPEPKTPLEATANIKFGLLMDDFAIDYSRSNYVNKDGKIEKTLSGRVWEVKATGRLKVPPIGVFPGHENTQNRHLVVIEHPRELRGLGQYTLRHYDEYKDPDEGFAYLSSFKRIVRVSSTTYQDNVAGLDYTYGDVYGIREPFAFWDFKSLDRKLMLFPEPKSPIPILIGSDINPQFKFDHGYAFPRMGWAITPVSIVEAVPKINHVYGKKVLYFASPPYWGGVSPVGYTDIYDRQLQLWKSYISQKDMITTDGIDYCTDSAFLMHDLQTRHTSIAQQLHQINRGTPLTELDLTMLIKLGR